MKNYFCWRTLSTPGLASRLALCGCVLIVLFFCTSGVAKSDPHQPISSGSKTMRVATSALNFPRQTGPLAGSLIEFRQFRDHLAVANFSRSDESTCSGALTIVGLSDNDPILNQGAPGLFLLIWQFDLCTFDDQLFVETRVPISTSEFEICPNLRYATLNTSVPVCDFVSGNCFDVFFNLTWTADVPLLPDPFHTSFVLPGQIVSGLLWNSLMSVGEVSGSITDGSADYTWADHASVGVITKTVQGFIVIQIQRPA